MSNDGSSLEYDHEFWRSCDSNRKITLYHNQLQRKHEIDVWQSRSRLPMQAEQIFAGVRSMGGLLTTVPVHERRWRVWPVAGTVTALRFGYSTNMEKKKCSLQNSILVSKRLAVSCPVVNQNDSMQNFHLVALEVSNALKSIGMWAIGGVWRTESMQ